MNTYYVIERRKDHKFISGSDFRYSPPRSIIADEYRPPLLIAEYELDFQLHRRRINLEKYKVTRVCICEIREYPKARENNG